MLFSSSPKAALHSFTSRDSLSSLSLICLPFPLYRFDELRSAFSPSNGPMLKGDSALRWYFSFSFSGRRSIFFFLHLDAKGTIFFSQKFMIFCSIHSSASLCHCVVDRCPASDFDFFKEKVSFILIFYLS